LVLEHAGVKHGRGPVGLLQGCPLGHGSHDTRGDTLPSQTEGGRPVNKNRDRKREREGCAWKRERERESRCVGKRQKKQERKQKRYTR